MPSDLEPYGQRDDRLETAPPIDPDLLSITHLCVSAAALILALLEYHKRGALRLDGKAASAVGQVAEDADALAQIAEHGDNAGRRLVEAGNSSIRHQDIQSVTEVRRSISLNVCRIINFAWSSEETVTIPVPRDPRMDGLLDLSEQPLSSALRQTSAVLQELRVTLEEMARSSPSKDEPSGPAGPGDGII